MKTAYSLYKSSLIFILYFLLLSI